jgi:hypothetical protein
MSRFEYATIVLLILLLIRLILLIQYKIRQHFIHKQCNYLCFACKYRYECDIFRRE